MIVLDYSDATEPVRGWATGDWHRWSKFHADQMFERHLQRALDEAWFLMHVGDALEMTTPTSKVMTSGAMQDQTANPEDQRKDLVRILRMFRDAAPVTPQATKKGVILGGNHEFRVDSKTGLDFIASVTDAVGDAIAPMSIPGIIEIRVGQNTWWGYMHHGEGPGTNPLTLADRIQRDVQGIDFILSGHIHCDTFDPAMVVTPQGYQKVTRIRCGHYLFNPPYQMRRPTTRMAPPGSWLLTLYPDRPKERAAEWTWMD